MKIKSRLTLGFLGMVMLCIVVGYVGYTGNGKIIEDFDIIVDETAPELVVLGRVKALSNSLQTEAVSLALLPLIKGDENELREELRQFEEVNQELDKTLAGTVEPPGQKAEELTEGEEASLFEKIKEGKSKLYQASLNLVRVAKEERGIEAILEAKEELETAEEALNTVIKLRFDSEVQELKRRDDHADETGARTRTVILTVSAISIFLAFLLGFFISRSIVIPISRLRMATVVMSQGDLSVRSDVKSRDEIGELSVSFNTMADSIQDKNEELQTFNEELQTSNEELKATTEELEASNEELTSSNEEIEAANEELREAQEKLVQQEKLAAVGQLASGIGHELRNPLGVLKNAVYYIKTKVGMEDEKLAKHLRIMEKEIDNSTKIIGDLLGFSRTRKPDIAPTDIHRVIEDAISAVELPTNVRISKEFDKQLPQAMVDPDQMRQVFLNLALNAIQSMNEGGMLTVATRRSNAWVEIQFRDTGSGIPQEHLKKLFDPFFTTKARGVGLGLAVSHGIIERHNGRIEVQSVVGKGTTFTILLSTG
ncbi:MAG: HAMP domain-containing protein [Deltaproteobacteria bacterium]|nr:HAMP domain-containing protein [Deltaproteobacteria bacterium]